MKITGLHAIREALLQNTKGILYLVKNHKTEKTLLSFIKNLPNKNQHLQIKYLEISQLKKMEVKQGAVFITENKNSTRVF